MVDGTAQSHGAHLSGKRAIVTGGARGIGAQIVRRLHADGARVAIIDLLADEAATLVADTDAVAITADLADAASTETAMSTAIDALSGVDVLVNNAGVFRITPLLDISATEWDWIFSINARAMLLTTQVAARSMIAAGRDGRQRGGRIVNIASMGGKVGAAGQAHYAASKAAVISLTQVSARELGEHGINVNAVCPGYVLTEMGAGTRTDAQVAEWSALSPLGRLGTPDDVAKMVGFLVSSDADYCTGQAMNVTGGMIFH